MILTLLLLAIVIGSFMPFEAKQWLGTPYHHHAFHFIVFLVSAFVMMWLVRRWHASNCVRYRDEIAHLLSIARLDKH